MAKITRKTAKLFGVNATSTQIEQFASKEQLGSLVNTTDPATIQALPAWGLGWTAAQYLGQFAPYYQDRNAVDLVAFYQVAYILQMGIPEWDAGTNYYTDSVIQYSGNVYMSAQDNNAGNTPPLGGSNALWTLINFPLNFSVSHPTRTVLTSGSGTYNTPLGCVRLFVRMIGGGASGQVGGEVFGWPNANGTATTFGTLTANGGNWLYDSGRGLGYSVGGTATGGDINITGANGDYPGVQPGSGAISKFGGVAWCNVNSQPLNAPANSGAGGAGSDFAGGGGGGAGGYLEKTINSPSASYAYAIGVGGTPGPHTEQAATYGGSGIIIVDEFYF